ncbi:hypothetical protein, partial [Rhizobium johnstonii]|uniref:hypothetical protein n=1 Tax=Rhizobium johnstonii TaxID=3019933 RepID=UPI003F9D9B54
MDVGACISVLGTYSHTIDVVSMEMSPGRQGGNQMKYVSVVILGSKDGDASADIQGSAILVVCRWCIK